jgi:hypothetical protein
LKRKNRILNLLLIALLFTMACNLLDVIFPPEQNDEGLFPSTLEEDDEDVPISPTETPVPAATDTAEPTDEPVVETSSVPWIVMLTDSGIIYMREGENTVNSASKSGTIKRISPAPVGGRLAVIRSEKEDGVGHLWLELFDLTTGEWKSVTPLTNEESVINDWMEDLGENNREANIAIDYAPPVWSADGQTLVFIGAQEGEFARPYAYHLDTGELHDLSLGGEVHYYNPKLSPDDEFIVVASANQFGTGAGYDMDAYSIARVSGGEASRLFEVYGIDLKTWGWLDNQTVVISGVDIMAGTRNLRTLDIFSGEERTIVKDYIVDVAVATGEGSVMFTSIMEELLDFSTPETIAESGLYHWDRQTQQLTKVHDFTEYSSRLEWNVRSNCYYADLPKRFMENEDVVWVFDATGNAEGECQPINPLAQDIPQVSASGAYYAWANLVFGDVDQNAFYVQGFDSDNEIRIANGSVYQYGWHPINDVLLFTQNKAVFLAEAPEFSVRKTLGTSDKVLAVFWVNP